MAEEYRLEVEVSQEKALASLNALNRSLERTDANGRKVDGIFNTLAKSSGGMTTSLNLLNRSSSYAGEGFIKMNRSSNDLNGSILLLTKSLLSYEIAARAISAADEYNNIQNRLKLVTHNQQELNIATSTTFDIAQKTGAVWSSVVQVYQRFLDISGQVGKSQYEIGKVTETVTKAVAMSGATAESANAAVIQFSQGLASGVLRGQEFNSVAEQTPALLDAIARGLGVNRSKLRDMSKEGKLTTEVIIGALEKAEKSTDELFGRMTLGVGATFNKLRNATVQWVGELNEASGATTVLTSAMNMLAEHLDGAAFLAGAAAIAYMTKSVIANIEATMAKRAADAAASAATIGTLQATAASTAATVTSTAAKVAAASASVAEAEAMVANATTTAGLVRAKTLLTQRQGVLAAATAADTAATAANTAATNALATATSRLNMLRGAAMGLVGGPAGLIALGIGAASMLLLLNKQTDINAETTKNQAQYLEMTNAQLEKMTDLQRQVAKNSLAESFKEQNKELEIMESKFQSVVNDIITNMAKMGDSTDLYKAREIQRLLLTDQISFEDALERINKLPYVTAEQRAQLLQAEKKYNDTFDITKKVADTLKKLGIEVKIAGDSAQNAALMNNRFNASLDETKKKAEEASKAVQDFRKKQLDQIAENAYFLRRVKDTSKEQAAEEAKLYAETKKPLTAQDKQLIAFNLQLKAKKDAIEQADKDAEKLAKKQAKNEESEAKKQAREATQAFEKRRDEYKNYVDDTRNEIDKLTEDYQKFLTLYDEFGAKDPAVFEKVTNHFRAMMAEAQMQVEEYAGQWADYYNTDMDNINQKYKREEYLLRHTDKISEEQRKKSTEDLKKAWANEIDLIYIREDIERLEAQKTFMTEKAYLEELNKLKLKQIEYTPNLSPDQKQTRMQGQQNEYQNQVNQMNQNTLNDYISTMQNAGLGGGVQSELQTQLDMNRDVVRAAYEEGILDKETYTQALADLDTKYWNDTHQMWATMWGDSLSGWSSFFQNVQGENSSAYKALFAMQKGFAIATAALNIQKAISDGWATGSTIYEKLAAVATIITETGSIMSNISQITMGYKDGGYTGSIGKNNIAGVVHGNEYVMPAEQTARYRTDLERMRNGTFDNNSGGSGMQVQVNNTFNIQGGEASSEGSKGDMLLLGNALEQAILKVLRDSCGQGGIINRFVKGQL